MVRSASGVDIPRCIDTHISSPVQGVVKWNAKKSIWISSMYVGALIGVVFFFTWQAFILFIISTSIVLCFGHSLGMHRKLIHASYNCPKWLEYIFVYLGSLVGLGGPFTMIYTHDMRDWAQRKSNCHDYFAHRNSLLKDAWWQMHCDVELAHPPNVALESSISHDRIYRFLESTWMQQQLPWAIIFFMIGGWSWVFWGVCARVAVSVSGHWLIGYFAHRQGEMDWHVEDAGVQGYNIKCAGLITFGECWHNNHHAFPGSAKIGLEKGQVDPGWWVLKALAFVGLVSNIQTPETLVKRANVRRSSG